MQDDQLDRVSGVIAPVVLDFCRSRVGKSFHMANLRSYVDAFGVGLAPESAPRVLRDLRAQGLVDVRCVNRAQSEYEVVKA